MLLQRIHASRAALRPQCSKQVHAAVHTDLRASWKMANPGRVANLQLQTEPLPQLQPGQALVKVKAIGLNFADVFCCLGLYAAAPKGNYVPGLEFAGEVVEVLDAWPESSTNGSKETSNSASTSTSDGSDTSRIGSSSSSSSSSTPNTGSDTKQRSTVASTGHAITPGARVMGVTRFGAYATHVVLDTRYLRPVPESWSYAQAAAFPVQSITAMYALNELGALQPGGAVLVQSAAGGVGLQALQIARRMGAAAVLGLVGSEEKARFLRGMFSTANGSNAATDTSTSSNGSIANTRDSTATNAPGGASSSSSSSCAMEFAVRPGSAADLQQLLSSFLIRHHLQGFDCVLDSVLGAAFKPCFNALAPCGRYVVFGAAALTPSPGVDLTRGWGLLQPRNWAAAAQLLWAWSRRPSVDVASLPGSNRSILGFNLIWIYEKDALMAKLFADLLALGLPPPHVGHVFGFAQMVEALELLQSGRTVGKVVVEVDKTAF